MPTLQETFDTVARFLIRQGRRSYSDTGCKYRAPNGDRCAVGCLIPDELYSEGFEGTGVKYDIAPTMFQLGYDVDFLERLQEAHDEWHQDWLHGWAEEMRQLAGEYGLSTSVLEELP